MDSGSVSLAARQGAIFQYQSLSRPVAATQPPAAGNPERPTQLTTSSPAAPVIPVARSTEPLPTRTNSPLSTSNAEGARSTAAASGSDAQQAEQLREQREVQELAARDREVRAHEAAHAAAGGSIAGSPSLQYTRGPDGRLYATAGEVSIDTSAVAGDPRATIEKAETIIRAATAPANPSPQDLRVAAQAQALLVEARAELLRQESGGDEEAVTETSESSQATDADENEPAVTQDREADSEGTLGEAADERSERAREQREAFADQLQELNRRFTDIQQRLIDSGGIASVEPQGNFLDLVV